MKDLGNGFTVMTLDEMRDLGRKERVDESRKCEWQCPTCRNRVLNWQREKTADGSPCWGCQKYCDTLDASYFGGRACRLYEKGESNAVWP